jgi:hypothetical protein
VLIRNTAEMHQGESYVEIDLNVHKFGSLPKKALATLIDKFVAMRISTAFCIESRVDGEMPETMLCSSTCYKPSYEKALRWEDVNGTNTTPSAAAASGGGGDKEDSNK